MTVLYSVKSTCRLDDRSLTQKLETHTTHRTMNKDNSLLHLLEMEEGWDKCSIGVGHIELGRFDLA